MNPNTPSPPEPQSRFLRACQRLPVDATPVWFMRQAGRYMAEYRAIRARYSLLEIVQRPEIAAEVTLQPVHALGVDAAILFADILLPIVPMGLKLEFAQGEGPVIHNPIRSARDVARLGELDPQADLGHVLETVRLVRAELEGRVPLIGFAGAPFTLASYVVEGGASRSYIYTKSLMYSAPEVWHQLLEKLQSHRGLSAGPGRGWGPGRAVVRLLGGRAQPAGLRPFREALFPAGPFRRDGERRAGHPLRHRNGYFASSDEGSRGHSDRPGLAHTPR